MAAQSPEPTQDFSIYLAKGIFDPLQSLPELPQSLTYSPAEVEAIGVYIVQFAGPIEDAWKEQVASVGGQFGPYIPNFAFLVRLDPAALEAVRAMPEVRWVGPYEAAYKLSESITPADTRTYRVLLAPWAAPERAAQEMSAFAVRPVADLSLPVQVEGVDIESVEPGRGEKILAADLDGAGLEQAARMGDVLWIEPVYLNKTFNDVGGGIMGGAVAWSNGYTGTGQSINVTDTGFDTGSAASVHADFAGHTANVASWPVVAADYGGGCVIQNPGANDGAGDKDSGHGTHVAGSVAGNGARSGGQIKGLAYTATVNFQAIEQWTDFPSACSASDGYYLTAIPMNMAPMFQQAYNWGARIQNESWGGGNYGEYDDQAAQFDSFIASHQDFAVFVAAGNDGTDTAEDYGWGDGYVDEGSISSPATAKNVITIGASENERSSGGISDYTWAEAWPADYYRAPTGTDLTSNSRNHMAAFSSRGPMDDGRIKPDLVAPGTNILSVRSSLATSDGWGPYNSYYMYMGGTSMASPLAAGAGTLVRQYYQTKEKVTNPSAALIKATLINTATDITGYGNTSEEAGQPIPNNHEGWGRINVGAATTAGRKFVDHATGLNTGTTHTYLYNVTAGKPFKVSLAWSDPAATPLAWSTLVNDLNLKVTAPNGTTTYLGNMFSGGWSTTGGYFDYTNNVENVYIQSPTAGVWKVEVIGYNVPSGPQRYALVVGGNVSTPPPAAFSKAAPATGATGIPTNTVISWNASAGATSYEYCIDTVANYACETSWVSASTATSKSLTGLTAGTTYYWQVRAKNSVGTKDANDGAWWKFTTQVALPGAFNKTSPANAATTTGSSVTLSWGASTGATKYEYCIDDIANYACEGVWTSTGTARTKVLTGLTAGTTYFWQVRAVNGGGSTMANAGAWWKFTPTVVLPAAFDKSFPATGATIRTTKVTLGWAASQHATSYQYCYDTTNNGTCEGTWTSTGTSNRAFLQGLTNGTTYYWHVRANNTDGTTYSNANAMWSFTVNVISLPFRNYIPVTVQ